MIPPSKLAFAAAISTTALSAAHASAQTCQWASNNEYGSLGYQLVPNVTVASQSGPVLTNATINLEFWGAYWKDPGPGLADQQKIVNAVRNMLGDPSFWSRYAQYGVSTGSMGQVFNRHTDLRGRAGTPMVLTDTQIQNFLLAENAVTTVVVLAPYLNRQGDGFAGGRHSTYRMGVTTGAYAEVEYGSSSGPHLWNNTPLSGDVSAMSEIVAHEIMEMVTDPLPAPRQGYIATQPSQVAGMEIGDFCNGLDRFVNGVRWHQTWLQNQCRCDGSGITFSNQWLTLTDPNGQTKCLDLPASNTNNGTLLDIWDCVSGAANELWSAWSDGTIRSAVDSNKCIDLNNQNTNNNAPIDIYDCVGAPNLVWSVTSSSAQNHSGNIFGFGNRCLDLPNGNMTDGTTVDYYDCFDNTWNESWSVTAPR